MPKICIDAGHYGKQNWNLKANPVYYESVMAWDLHLMIKEELGKYRGIEVVTTRKNQAKDLPVTDRGRAAAGCDLLLSVHSNACNSENVDRAVVIYPVSGKEAGLAAELAKCITATMELHDQPQTYIRWNSAHNADYYGVIRGAAAVGVPALILEHSFHTCLRSVAWLQKQENLRKLAVAEAAIVANRYGCLLENEATDQPLPGSFSIFKTPYRVKIGAYNNIQNAINQYSKAHELGFDQTYIEDADGKVVMY